MNCSCFILILTQTIFLLEILTTVALVIAVQVLNPEWNDTSAKFTCSTLTVICVHQLGLYLIAGEGREVTTVDTVKSGLILFTGVMLSFLFILMSYDEDDALIIESDQYLIALIILGSVSIINVISFLTLTYWSDILVPLGFSGEVHSQYLSSMNKTRSVSWLKNERISCPDKHYRQYSNDSLYDKKKDIRRVSGSELTTPLIDREQMSLDESDTYLDDDGSSTLSAINQPTDTIDDDSDRPSHGIKRLLLLTKPERKELIIGCVILIIRLPFSLSIPHFVSEVIGALNNIEFDTAKRVILNLLIAGTIDAVLDFWCVYLFGRVKEKIILKLRSDTFRAILGQERDFFDSKSSGELASRLTADCGAMAADLTWFYRFSIEACVRVFVIVAYMFWRCPKLAIASCAIIPVVAMINKFYGDWLQSKGKQVQDTLAESNKVAQEALSCVQTVLAFAAEDFEISKYIQSIERNYHLNIQLLFATGVYFMVVATFLINTCVKAAILFLGMILIMQDQLEIHVLLSFILYQDQLQEYCMSLASSYSSLMRCSGTGDEVFSILDRISPEPATRSVDQRAIRSQCYSNSIVQNNTDDCMVSITLSNVDFSYPSRPNHKVLSGFDLHIAPGSTVALVGSSGCGKSTIVNLVERFYDPSDGCILINGRDLRSLDIQAHRERIGIVTQEPILFSGTILSNILYGQHYFNTSIIPPEVVEAAKLANAHDFIVRFPAGYFTEVGERGVQLSGGQKQRISIARAILKRPSILLLDEATSALDTESEQLVQEALDRLLVGHDVTTIVIAHRLQTVRNADIISVIDNGRVVEIGSHNELMSLNDGRYRRMVDRSRSKVDDSSSTFE